MKRLTLLAVAMLGSTLAAAADPVGVRAKGGQPEYLFLEKTPRAEAADTAQKTFVSAFSGRRRCSLRAASQA